RRQRGVARDGRNREPDQCKHERRWPGEREQDAEISGDALAALEAEPNRKQVPQESAEPSAERKLAAPPVARHEHRRRALEHVAEKRGGGEPLVSCAQHVGGAEIAGDDRAKTLRAGEPRQERTKRNRAAQIAERQGGGAGEQEGRVERWEHA